MLDPSARWSAVGARPAYAGLVTFGAAPYTEDPAELGPADAAVVGAPTDLLVTDRPGTRFGPRAIRAASVAPARQVETGVDAAAELRLVDFGDAPVVPGDVDATLDAIERTVAEVAATGALPVVLGGDHSITEAAVRGFVTASGRGPLGLVQLDAHADTAPEVFGVERSHGTWARRLIEQGHVDPARHAQLGLRGYWPGADVLDWGADRDITVVTAAAVRDLGIAAAVAQAALGVGATGPVWLTIDIDVLDPAFAPGTGTPEPGGLDARELLWACRELARRLDLAGLDVVEVAPRLEGTEDPTAGVASRAVAEALTGTAQRRADARRTSQARTGTSLPGLR